MAPRFAAVVVDALAAPADPALRDRLGPELHDHLRHVLRERAAAWAREAAATPELALHARTAAELPDLLAGHDGPVLLAAPDVPALGAAHVAAAAEDLADGVLLGFAPAGDGHPFLLVLDRPRPEVLRRAGAAFDELAALAAEEGAAFGMLRPERRLASLEDARAVRADPLAPAVLRDLLPPGL